MNNIGIVLLILFISSFRFGEDNKGIDENHILALVYLLAQSNYTGGGALRFYYLGV